MTFGPSRPGDYRAKRVSSERARTELGWTPRFDFAAGLATHARVVPPAMTAPPAARTRGAVAGYGGRPPRRIAVVPAYNEEPMVAPVLEELYPLVDELVVVDDGSTDGTRREIEQWLPGHDRCHLLWHDVNQGMSEAYILALTMLRDRLDARRAVAERSRVHRRRRRPARPRGARTSSWRSRSTKASTRCSPGATSRTTGPYKKLGNFVLSGWASLWAGNRLHDVESGYRIFRLGSLAHALDFYTGYKYSETVEVAVVMSRLGYRVRNDHVVPVPVSRSRTRLRDAVIDLAVIPVAAARVWRREPRPEDSSFGRDVAGHIAACSVIAVLLAIALDQGTSGVGELLVAMLAALAAAVIVRRVAQPPTLALLGPVLAGVAAWLVPQRPDIGSAAALVAVFTAGAALAAPAIRRPHPFVLGRIRDRPDRPRPRCTNATRCSSSVCSAWSAPPARRWPRALAPARSGGRARSRSAPRSRSSTFGMTAYFGASTVSAQWFGGGVTHGPRNSGEVAITFDDEPNSDATPQIMNILDAAHVHATFFVVGQALVHQPDIVRSLYRPRSPGRQPLVPPRRVALARPALPGAPAGAARVPAGDRRVPGVVPAAERRSHAVHGPRRAPARDANRDVGRLRQRRAAPDRRRDRASACCAGARSGSIIDLRDGIDGASAANKQALVDALPGILDGLRSMHLEAGAARPARRRARVHVV